MTHRAETIIDTVKTRVTGLATTGTRVFRGRGYPLQEADLPALLLYMGADDVIGDLSAALLDCQLQVHVDAVVKTTAQVDTTLNLIREEVTIALQADHTQGLAFVIDTAEQGADEPDISNDGEQPAGSLRTRWLISYRRSRTNPGA